MTRIVREYTDDGSKLSVHHPEIAEAVMMPHVNVHHR